MMDNYNTDKYDEIRGFLTALLSSGLKGNQCLKKALLTGVMRVSHESMFSGLNNIKTYDVFNDSVYTDDYGLTEKEASELSELAGFDLSELKSWYNGVKINGHEIYNTYSVMSYLDSGQYSCFWGMSGTMEMIANLLNDGRKIALTKLLNGEQITAIVDSRISLKRLSANDADEAFYSLLVQGGYLALDEKQPDNLNSKLSIPNRELMRVWKDFILTHLYGSGRVKVKTLFDNVSDLNRFSEDLERFLNDALSYHDLAVYKGEDEDQVKERVYHIFMLGMLSAYDDIRCRRPMSNRESGDGRYDILAEKSNHYFIFEFKSCGTGDDLEERAENALDQINSKRYGADLDKNKPLIKIGVAFCSKKCKVKCG